VIDRFNIGQTCVRVAVISYSDNAVVSIELTRYSDRNSLKQAVSQLRLLNGGSNLGNALNLLLSSVFPDNVIQSATRSGQGLTAIVITDKLQSSPNEANTVKSKGVRIIAAGINYQNGVFQSALYTLATDNYASIVNDYSQLGTALNAVATQYGCYRPVTPTVPAPTLPPATAPPGPAEGMCISVLCQSPALVLLIDLHGQISFKFLCPAASRRGRGYSAAQFHTSVCMCLCNNFAALRRDPCCSGTRFTR